MSTAGKELCNCGKMAVWCYMPGYSGGGNSYSCDDCVPRGCECNQYSTRAEDYSPPGDVSGEGISPTEDDEPIKWLSNHIWTRVDEQGREFPCCEYIYDQEGFEK